MTTFAASTSKNPAVASARACLDVLRGAAVLIEHNKGALVELLSRRAKDDVAGTGEQELAVLQGLGRHISDVIQLCTMTLRPASGGPAGSLQSPGDVAGVLESPEVTEVPTKRHREHGMQGGQHLPHHRHDAAAASVRQSSTSATVGATVLGTAELLKNIMGYLGEGSGGVWVRREALGRMALVCRAWRNTAHDEVLWGPLAKELIPRLADEDQPLTQDELKTGAAGSCRHYLVRCRRLTRERRLLDDYGWFDGLMLQCEVWDAHGFCMFSTENLLMAYGGDEVDILASGSGPLFSVESRPCFNPPPQTLREFLSERDLRVSMIAVDKRTGRRMDLWPNRYIDAHDVFRENDDLVVLSELRQMSSPPVKSPESVDVRLGLRFIPSDGVNGDGDDQTLWRVRRASVRFGDSDARSVGRLIWSLLQ